MLFIVKRLQFVVNQYRVQITMNILDNPAVVTIFTADLIALAPWIPWSPAGFNFNGDGTGKTCGGTSRGYLRVAA